jgi:N-methylhydantoinase A
VRDAFDERLARPLGVAVEEAAYGVFRTVNASMAQAIVRVTAKRGVDPRQLTMVVYGGNGPVHACRQAQELGIGRLLVPKTAPALSALGLLVADYSVDALRAYVAPASRVEAAEINRRLEEMQAQAADELAQGGIERDRIDYRRYLNIAYPGQTIDTSVPMAAGGGRLGPSDVARTLQAFHDEHERLHTFAARHLEPVVRAVRVQAVGRRQKPEPPARQTTTLPLSAAECGRRLALLADRELDGDGKEGWVEAPVYDGTKLGPGHRIEGPAIIEETFTTIVLHLGHRAEVDARGNYWIEV